MNFPWGQKPPWGGGGAGLHVTCDAHLRTWPGYSSQKSCVKIWFELGEPFKSYRGNKHKKTKKKKYTLLITICFLRSHNDDDNNSNNNNNNNNDDIDDNSGNNNNNNNNK